jgi:cytochrome c peroxidase
MKKQFQLSAGIFLFIGILVGCTKVDLTTVNLGVVNTTMNAIVDPFVATRAAFGTNIYFTNLSNYANQVKPSYINNDNTGTDTIKNNKATLGRILFYDKNLSINNTIACASCHKQAFAFSDTSLVSDGVLGGLTARHSMRLINARFANEAKFFWNERAASLEIQTTMPMQDHAEMGFSGLNGRGTLDTLLSKLSKINYYKEIFKTIYGDTTVTQNRLQESLAQFVRSIQSFDSKYDTGRASVNNEGAPFPNFTATENAGKNLFLAPPT